MVISSFFRLKKEKANICFKATPLDETTLWLRLHSPMEGVFSSFKSMELVMDSMTLSTSPVLFYRDVKHKMDKLLQRNVSDREVLQFGWIAPGLLSALEERTNSGLGYSKDISIIRLNHITGLPIGKCPSPVDYTETRLEIFKSALLRYELMAQEHVLLEEGVPLTELLTLTATAQWHPMYQPTHQLLEIPTIKPLSAPSSSISPATNMMTPPLSQRELVCLPLSCVSPLFDYSQGNAETRHSPSPRVSSPHSPFRMPPFSGCSGSSSQILPIRPGPIKRPIEASGALKDYGSGNKRGCVERSENDDVIDDGNDHDIISTNLPFPLSSYTVVGPLARTPVRATASPSRRLGPSGDFQTASPIQPVRHDSPLPPALSPVLERSSCPVDWSPITSARCLYGRSTPIRFAQSPVSAPRCFGKAGNGRPPCDLTGTYSADLPLEGEQLLEAVRKQCEKIVGCEGKEAAVTGPAVQKHSTLEESDVINEVLQATQVFQLIETLDNFSRKFAEAEAEWLDTKWVLHALEENHCLRNITRTETKIEGLGCLLNRGCARLTSAHVIDILRNLAKLFPNVVELCESDDHGREMSVIFRKDGTWCDEAYSKIREHIKQIMADWEVYREKRGQLICLMLGKEYTRGADESENSVNTLNRSQHCLQPVSHCIGGVGIYGINSEDVMTTLHEYPNLHAESPPASPYRLQSTIWQTNREGGTPPNPIRVVKAPIQHYAKSTQLSVDHRTLSPLPSA